MRCLKSRGRVVPRKSSNLNTWWHCACSGRFGTWKHDDIPIVFETSRELVAVLRTDQQRVPAQDQQGKRCTGHTRRRRVGSHGVGMKLGVKAAVHVVPDGCGHQDGCRYKTGSARFHHPDRDEQRSWLHAEQCRPFVVLHDPRVVVEQCRNETDLGMEKGMSTPGGPSFGLTGSCRRPQAVPDRHAMKGSAVVC